MHCVIHGYYCRFTQALHENLKYTSYLCVCVCARVCVLYFYMERYKSEN